MILVVAAIVAPLESLQGQNDARDVISGTVFVDENANGRFDEGEAGVSGVAVSDQVSVVVTNDAGGYRLDGPAFGLVFISAPAGLLPVGPFWRRVRDDDAGRIDFPLRRLGEGDEFTFIHASDTHVSEASVGRVRMLKAIVEERMPDFVIVTGDLVRDALRVGEAEASSYYEMYVREVEQFPVPVWSVPGNHENFGIERHQSLVSAEHPLYGKAMFRSFLGPTYFSFTYGKVHFVGLDTVDYAHVHLVIAARLCLTNP